jgi:hypothetical protein
MQLSGEPLPPFLGGFQENSMRKTFLAIVAGLLLVPAALAAAPGDVTTAYAAYAPGTITIIDEFAPHRWVGPHAAQEWASDYDKHATATGVTDGVVKYGAPTRSVVDGDTAYVIIPALYTYKEHGKPMSEEGQMTFVLHTETTGWKIQGWTWTGVVPYSPK